MHATSDLEPSCPINVELIELYCAKLYGGGFKKSTLKMSRYKLVLYLNTTSLATEKFISNE